MVSLLYELSDNISQEFAALLGQSLVMIKDKLHSIIDNGCFLNATLAELVWILEKLLLQHNGGRGVKQNNISYWDIHMVLARFGFDLYCIIENSKPKAE